MAQVMQAQDGWTQFELEADEETECSACGVDIISGDEVWIEGSEFDAKDGGEHLCDECWRA